MGVLACSRRGCENILCGRYSQKFGYICNECFDELVMVDSNKTNVATFMNSEKPEKPIMDMEEFYSNIFKRNEDY